MSERERIAYEELRPRDVIQEGDEWQNPDGHWHPLVLTPRASMEVSDVLTVSDVLRARRPHSITALEKHRRDLIADILHVTGERNEARAEVVQLQLSCQEWIDRYNAEVANALQVSEQLTAAKDALKSAQRARDELQLQVDELRVDRDRLQGLIDELVDEPTARQVQDMLRTWATELDWAAGCFDSAGRDKVSAAQRVLVVAIERIGSMIDPEDSSAND